MTEKQKKSRVLAETLLEEVVEGNVASYRSILGKSGTPGHEYWDAVRTMYSGIDEIGKDTVLSIIKQVSVDAVATTLAIIDGAMITPENEEYELRSQDGNIISGDLHNIFLQMYQERGGYK